MAQGPGAGDATESGPDDDHPRQPGDGRRVRRGEPRDQGLEQPRYPGVEGQGPTTTERQGQQEQRQGRRLDADNEMIKMTNRILQEQRQGRRLDADPGNGGVVWRAWGCAERCSAWGWSGRGRLANRSRCGPNAGPSP